MVAIRAQIDVLREVFVEWLMLHEFDYDFWIYTQAEWSAREGDENYLKGAELIIAFDNSLYEYFNYPQKYSVEDELQDLAAGFGYYFEFGHHWNIGFYPLEGWPPLPPPNASYADRLNDFRWQAKRTRILKRCENRCEECGAEGKPLQVHHCYYRYGREPWQYPDGALLALCRECHEKRADAELRFRLFAPTVRTEDLQLLERVVRHSQYWFDRDDFCDFLTTLEKVPGGIPIGGPDGETLTGEQYEQRHFSAAFRALREKLYQMLQRMGHPSERGDDWPRNSL